MNLRRWGVYLLLAGMIVAGACRSSDAAFRPGASPRVPDREGIVTTATPTSITIGGRRFAVDKKLVVFSTYNHTKLDLGRVIGDYVHVGLRKGKALWVARVGRVVRADSDRPVVIYQGELKRVAGDRLEFADGTVLRLDEGLEIPADRSSGLSDVVINVKTRRVQGLTLPSEASTTSSTNQS